MCLVLPNTLLYLFKYSDQITGIKESVDYIKILLRDNTSFFDVLETSTVYLIEVEYASVTEIEELRTALINVFR